VFSYYITVFVTCFTRVTEKSKIN